MRLNDRAKRLSRTLALPCCRSPASIITEVAQLASSGYREVTLLGQNVNSYAHDADADAASASPSPPPLREGFRSKVPPARGSVRFADLLEQLARAQPEMRFRFTSPHPKDFPDELLSDNEVIMR